MQPLPTAAEVEAIAIVVADAQGGDAAALEAVVHFCQRPVYNLALRMLWNPADAEDATQEILVKIVTHMSQFRGASRFTTWMYRIATNHLLTLRQQRAERPDMTFAALRALRGEALDPSVPDTTDEAARIAEITRQCTTGMLLRLDREGRIAYILGELFEVPSDLGAEIMATTSATFRKRLSRARLRLRAYMADHCGLLNPALTCACGGGTCDAAATVGEADVERAVSEWPQIHRMATIFRRHPQVPPPPTLIGALQDFFVHSGLRFWEE